MPDAARIRDLAIRGEPHLPDDLGYPGPALQQVVRALLEREPGPGQGLPQRSGLRVGPVQHCDVGQAEPVMAMPRGAAGVQRVERRAAEQPLDLTGDPGGLGALVCGLVPADQRVGCRCYNPRCIALPGGAWR